MKRLLTLALCSIVMFSSLSSYAWVCSYRGPLGRVYSSNGEGYGYQAAKWRALSICRANKVHNGVPCEFLGCVRGY